MLRALLSIVIGVDIEGMVMTETYRDSLGYELSFTSLYESVLCENVCLLAKGFACL